MLSEYYSNYNIKGSGSKLAYIKSLLTLENFLLGFLMANVLGGLIFIIYLWLVNFPR